MRHYCIKQTGDFWCVFRIGAKYSMHTYYNYQQARRRIQYLEGTHFASHA